MPTQKWQAGTATCRFDRWDEFTGALAEEVRLLEQKTGRFLVVERTHPARYVQLASLADGGVLAEAVGNSGLMSHERLAPAACKRLAAMGWQRPRTAAPARANFWRQWTRPIPRSEIAALAAGTLREAFGIATPAELRMKRGEFPPPESAPTTEYLTRTMTGLWASGPSGKGPGLGAGSIVRSAISGRAYRVGPLLGSGGFGAAYQAEHVGGGRRLAGSLALKVSAEPRGWYREAYFGDLLSETSGIVRTHEAFAWMPRNGAGQPLYCLVSEHVEGGDLTRFLKEHLEPWPEWKARREMIRLLRAVSLIHASGAVHRDITPNNVFVSPDGVLKLGDFGIAMHRVGRRDVRADAFNGWFAPPAIRSGKVGSWLQADDVYHLGQLFALLLHGRGKSKVTAGEARKLDCTPETKAVIQRCIGERRKRFTDAGQVLAALVKQSAAKPVGVRSLKGRRVVFTGPLTIPRAKAERLVKRAGGIVEHRVSHRTDVIVLGKQSPHWKAEKKGQKLLDVDRERELGHMIAAITERRFLSLVQAR